MGIYDIISQIAQSECSKVYNVKISIGIADIESKKLLINDLEFDLSDVILSKTAYDALLLGEKTVVCIIAENCIFITDELVVIE
ncbi:MAG: hypothetical protein R3Y12_00180 [Clostridia bacterium]